MRRIAVGVALIGTCLAIGAPAPFAPAKAAGPVARAPADLNPLIQDYCTGCHNDATLLGNLSLDTFDVAEAHERAEVAEKMIVKLRAGMMPPPDADRPDEASLLELVATLESVVDEAAASRPNPGSRRFQRLNRKEYERVVRDLLDLEIDASRWLPADTFLGSFDNMSAAQGLSTTLLEAYMRAASEVSRIAVGNPEALPASTKYVNPIEVSQHAWDHIEGTPYGTRGGMVVTHDFPADGYYVFTIETLFGSGVGFEDVDLSIDGEGVARLALEHGGNESVPIRTEPVFVRAGQRRIAAAFVRRIEGPYDDRLSPHAWSFVGGEDSQAWANYGITALPHLSDLIVTGPERPEGVSSTREPRADLLLPPEDAGRGSPLRPRDPHPHRRRGLPSPGYRHRARRAHALLRGGRRRGRLRGRSPDRHPVDPREPAFHLSARGPTRRRGAGGELPARGRRPRLAPVVLPLGCEPRRRAAAPRGRGAPVGSRRTRRSGDAYARRPARRDPRHPLRLPMAAAPGRVGQPARALSLPRLHGPAPRRSRPRDPAALPRPRPARREPPAALRRGLHVPERAARPALRNRGRLRRHVPPRRVHPTRPGAAFSVTAASCS